MEKKTTHRIIGILVVVALIIILLPLLFDGNSSTTAATQSASLKAPPFPEQDVQSQPQGTAVAVVQPVAPSNTPENTDSAAMNNDVMATAEKTTTDNTTNAPAGSLVNAAATPDDSSDAIKINDDGSATVIKPTQDVIAKPTVEAQAATTVDAGAKAQVDAITAPEVAKPTVDAIVPKTEATLKSASAAPVKAKHKVVHAAIDIQKLKHAAWAVQMGSFKNKTNAQHLANQLRAKGYKAFTREFKSAQGQSTRVFVGPEFKQASAASLASKIHQTTSMQGIVVPIKPLAL